MPVLRRARPARVVNVASAGQAPLDFDDLMLERGYDGFRAYCQSKLAMVMASFELAARLDPGEVTVNALHPGSLLDTKMVREGFGARKARWTPASRRSFTATSLDLEGVSGQYFDRTRPARANAQAYDAEARRTLWRVSQQLSGIEDEAAAARQGPQARSTSATCCGCRDESSTRCSRIARRDRYLMARATAR